MKLIECKATIIEVKPKKTKKEEKLEIKLAYNMYELQDNEITKLIRNIGSEVATIINQDAPEQMDAFE